MIWINVPASSRRHEEGVEWQPISTAPFDRELELAVLFGEDAHALVFPCRRVLRGWIKCSTLEQIDLQPTHWREWRQEA
jgi:hypothetical protein